jgi:3-deoxy-D-arabino-heptulosonate 7-phosphate (DAHP) synthase
MLHTTAPAMLHTTAPAMLQPRRRRVKAAGAAALRGGALKPRTSPYAFAGLGDERLRLLAEARVETGCPWSPR